LGVFGKWGRGCGGRVSVFDFESREEQGEDGEESCLGREEVDIWMYIDFIAI
jgi:hypothetical protein